MSRISRLDTFVAIYWFSIEIVTFPMALSSSIPNIYSGCGVTKGCLGSTNDCVKNKNCPVILTFKDDWKFFTFEMLSHYKGGNGYNAFGLSHDKSMGHDLVVECVTLKSGQAGIYQSYNADRTTNIRINGTECKGAQVRKGLLNCRVIVSGSKLYCKFSRAQNIQHRKDDFDLIYHRMYVIVATGNNVSPNNLGKHSAVMLSDHPIDFSNYKTATLSPSVGVQRLAHGILLVICFIVLVPNGIFIARYFKESFTHIIILDRKLWFSIHFTFMSVAYIVFLTAILLMLLTQKQMNKGWPDLPSSALHAKLGSVVVLLFTLQMVFGVYRPSEKNVYMIYSTVHSMVGSTSYVIALTNIVYSFYMGMPCEIKWIALGAIMWTLLWHIVMIAHFYWLDSNLGLKRCRALRPWPLRMVLFDDAPGTKQRIRIFIAHLLGSIAFAITMIVEYVLKQHTCPCEEDYCRVSEKSAAMM